MTRLGWKASSKVLQFWADQFPNGEPEHYVFPSERYGAGGDKFEPVVFDVDPSRAINSWKEAWESVKENTGVSIRFHDLRHTTVTRMLEGGAPLSVVAAIMGWSPATTVRMAKRYGHIGQVAQRQAVELLDAKPKRQKKSSRTTSTRRGHKKGHSQPSSIGAIPAKALKRLAPQAGLEPATLRLTVAAQGFLVESYRIGIFRTINDLSSFSIPRRVIPNHPIFHGEGAQKGAQPKGAFPSGDAPFFMNQEEREENKKGASSRGSEY